MLFRQVRLSNVGLYRDNQTLDFSRDRARPVTLIGGRNGAGKTTLLNAIPLVLYGNRAKALIGAAAYPEYLNKLVHKGSSKASIALEFDRREGGKASRYVIEREWSRSATGKATDTLYVSVNDKPRSDLEANWPEFVEGIMPLSVSGLAIFDGEKIEALADVGNSADVLRTSLYGLLGLDLVERLQRDLAEYRRKAAHQALPNQRAMAAGLRQAEDRLAVALADADGVQSELRAAERSLELSEAELAVATERLQEAGGDRVAARDHLHAELAAAESNTELSQRRLEALVAGDLPLLLVRPLLAQVVGMGERSQAASEAELLLVRMKERDERLVREVTSQPGIFSSAAADALEQLLAADRQHYEVDHSGGFDVDLGAMSTSRHLVGDVGTDLRAEAADLVAKINSSVVVAALARRTLESVPTGDAFEEIVRSVAEAEARIRSSKADVTVALDRVAEADRKVVAAQREVDRLASEVLEAGVGDADSVRIGREIDRAEITLANFSARIIERNIGRITENVTRSLQALLRKEGLISRLSINPGSLEISLFGRDRQPLDPKRLSAGERQMLATAVLWGLSRSTGRTLPTVIDTPVGRLDRSHRTNMVTRYFPSAARQVVLLSTDEEIVGNYLGQLEPHIGCSYLLDYDEADDATEIREGYFS